MIMWYDLLVVVLAALAGFVVGGIWYGPLLGKPWMAEHGFSQENLQNADMTKIYSTTFLLSIVSAIFLGFLFAHIRPEGLDMVVVALGVALGFIVPAFGISYLFSRKTMRLFLIDAGYWLLFYAVMGGVFAASAAFR